MRIRYIVLVTLLLFTTGCTDSKELYSQDNSHEVVYQNNEETAESTTGTDWKESNNNPADNESYKDTEAEDVDTDSSSSDILYYVSNADRLFNEFINNELPAEYTAEDGSTCYCYYRDLRKEGFYIEERIDLDNDGEYELILDDRLTFKYFLDAMSDKIIFLKVNPDNVKEHIVVEYTYFDDLYWIVIEDFMDSTTGKDVYEFYNYCENNMNKEFVLSSFERDNVRAYYYNNQEMDEHEFYKIKNTILNTILDSD